jgi:hypothetical protein
VGYFMLLHPEVNEEEKDETDAPHGTFFKA